MKAKYQLEDLLGVLSIVHACITALVSKLRNSSKLLKKLPPTQFEDVAEPGGAVLEVELQTIHRFHNRFTQSRRRPLLGPSPDRKRLLALSHLRH